MSPVPQLDGNLLSSRISEHSLDLVELENEDQYEKGEHEETEKTEDDKPEEYDDGKTRQVKDRWKHFANLIFVPLFHVRLFY